MSRPALAAERALAVIDLLCQAPAQRFTLTEIGRSTGVNPASLHALLAVLERAGYLVRHPMHRTYTLGPALVAAGAGALEQQPALREAADGLDALSARLQLEVVLTAPAGADIVVVARAGHASAFGESLHVGQRLPLAPPLGTVFLAWAPPDQVDAWLNRSLTPLSGVAAADHRRSLAPVRERGFAIALDSAARRSFGTAVSRRTASLESLIAELAAAPYQLESVDEGRSYDVSMIAAPIFDASGQVTAALTATGFAPALGAPDLRRVAAEIKGVATIVTKRTQGRSPGE